ncbi:MAG TPA: cob(I)yrinic acid a,c-diamide adenosyltransferase [Candidatus Binatia bacterium]|nr:cob(I)yrinic acid a,c-diamide adenosyltransferase [Candidatus Binatia bacterium]
MGHRLSKIVTRTGDAGETGLTGGGRVRKTHARVHALGEVDELNSTIGLLLAQRVSPALRGTLTRVQHELFNLGGELSMPGGAGLVQAAHVAQLEQELAALNAKLPPLKEFVLPGGTPPVAAAHLARAVCRRAERAVWTLHEREPLSLLLPRYLNRLSDYLFVAARALSRRRTEATWAHVRRRKR